MSKKNKMSAALTNTDVETTESTDSEKLDTKLNAIDAAIAAAQARKNAKDAAAGKPAKVKGEKVAKEPKEPKRPRLTDEEKTARQVAKDEERAARKVARDAARAEKRAEKEANRKAPHMSKVEKARAKLPALTAEAEVMFQEIVTNAPAAQVAALALHLAYFNRVQATQRALTQKLTAGDSVRIVGGDPRFIGMTGTVNKVQRIRCYCDVPGMSKPIYLFTSDVEVIESEATAATA